MTVAQPRTHARVLMGGGIPYFREKCELNYDPKIDVILLSIAL